MSKPTTDASSSTSSSLIERVQRCDPNGWRQLVDRYGSLIYYWCRHSGLQGDDAADVAQEVFQSVHRGIAEFSHEGPEATFRGWLWTITRHRLADHFRRTQAEAKPAGGTDAHQRLLELSADEPPSSATASAVRTRIDRALTAIRGDFSDETWQAFRRAALEERTSAEVSQELGISANAVRKAKARVLRRLREELGEP